MKIGIIGNGVVGFATAETWTKAGHEMLIWDKDPKRASHAINDVLNCQYVMVCVPTPGLGGRGGELDMSCLDEVAPKFVGRSAVVIIRSTLPLHYFEKFTLRCGCPAVYYPEFLTERTAEYDAANPALSLIGIDRTDYGFAEVVAKVHGVAPMGVLQRTAVLIKLMSNAYGATLVGLMNEFHEICKSTGVDWNTVRCGLLETGRVVETYTHVPGPDGKPGWGGKCWPKDVDQLRMYGRTPLLDAVTMRNFLDREEG